MTPEQEADLVEKMADEFGDPDPTNTSQREAWLRAIRLAEPVIRDAALEEAANHLNAEAPREGNDDAIYTVRFAASAVRALKSTNRPAPQDTK